MTDEIEVFPILKNYISEYDVVITGDASGVDELTIRWCRDRGIPCISLIPAHKYYKFPYHPMYYHARNMQMVDNCGTLLAIWDGKSTGTKFTIDYARRKSRKIIIHQKTLNITNDY